MKGEIMNYLLVIMLSAVSLLGGSSGCNKGDTATTRSPNTFDAISNNTQRSRDSKMRIKIGSKTFTATLSDNETAAAFKEMLPLTLQMDELNGNEKKYDLSKALPVSSANPRSISKTRAENVRVLLSPAAISRFDLEGKRSGP